MHGLLLAPIALSVDFLVKNASRLRKKFVRKAEIVGITTLSVISEASAQSVINFHEIICRFSSETNILQIYQLYINFEASVLLP